MKQFLLAAATTATLLLVLSSSSVSAQSTNSTRVTFDPNILNWLRKVLGALGANSLLDGTRFTNQAKLRGPLNSFPPSFAESEFNVNFAAAAYCRYAVPTWSCPYCVQNYSFVSEYSSVAFGTYGFFAKNDDTKTIVLSFRGTVNVPNLVVEDAILLQVPATDNSSSKILVYAGFKTAAQSLFPEVVSELQNLTSLYPDYKVIVTGHSLGAAQATLTLFYFKYLNLFPNTLFELYTYGLPRVGNRYFADYMNALPIKIGRTVHRGDVIPHVLSAATLNYYHFQNEIWIFGNNESVQQTLCATDVYEDPNCSDSLGPLYNVLDHFVNYYNFNYFTCIFNDPVDFLIQIILPIRPIIPLPLIAALNLLPVSDQLTSLLNALDALNIPVVG